MRPDRPTDRERLLHHHDDEGGREGGRGWDTIRRRRRPPAGRTDRQTDRQQDKRAPRTLNSKNEIRYLDHVVSFVFFLSVPARRLQSCRQPALKLSFMARSAPTTASADRAPPGPATTPHHTHHVTARSPPPLSLSSLASSSLPACLPTCGPCGHGLLPPSHERVVPQLLLQAARDRVPATRHLPAPAPSAVAASPPAPPAPSSCCPLPLGPLELLLHGRVVGLHVKGKAEVAHRVLHPSSHTALHVSSSPLAVQP